MDTIKLGQFIIVQRHDVTKLQKFDKLECTITIGRDIIELKNINGNKYFDTFKMKLKTNATKKKRLYELELCDHKTNIQDILKSFESGADNRNINDTQDVSFSIFPAKINHFLTKPLFFSHKRYQ